MKKVILLLLLIVNLAPGIQKGEFSFFSFSSVHAQYYGGAEIGHDIEDEICITPPNHISGSWDNGDGTYTSYSCTTTYSGCDDPGSTECSYYTWGDMAPKDCAGVPYGTAYISDCGCVGGTTGRSENDCMDCNGDINGGAYVADCGCIGGNTGIASCTPPNEDPPVSCNNPSLSVGDVFVTADGEASTYLEEGVWGRVYPENVVINLSVCLENNNWIAIVNSIRGKYSFQSRLLPGVQGVTGPSGNTNSSNFCQQVTQLKLLGNARNWYMIEAVIEHEKVHVTRMEPALEDVTGVIESAFENLSVPNTGQSEAVALQQIQQLPAYINAWFDAKTIWMNRLFILVEDDHDPGGPTEMAERAVVNPMIAEICSYSISQLWQMCMECL